MGLRFEEIDWQETPQGEISLRRRRDPVVDADVYEVKLGEEYLMSSLFTVAEIELARIGLAALDRSPLRVLVGGLGLGCTAAAVLEDDRVADLTVVEASAPVLDWHRRGLLPDVAGLAEDSRCTLVHDDFFARMRREPETAYDVIALDIDHTPRHVLHHSHEGFYSVAGLTDLTRHLVPDGVFTLWSDDPPDADFETHLAQVFTATSSHVVEFANPLTGGTSSNTVYLGRRG
ncbi:spermidine synthase [Nocardioides panacisoli]|uniref:spermidine synthase n=1 Tax=Nocardioides panacisoli TaxID=627624 RepID=UPI001C637A97|nr:spermidine synthase [Nocardioides panacisoli]QYJ03222.1 spermidine synthase [Nocardioides panacisoli]